NLINTIDQVYIQRSDGTNYYPRLESFDLTTNQGNFSMLDGLGRGSYQLHLSGRLGLTDFAGNPLKANDSSGDYVVHFSVSSDRGTTWTDQEPNGDLNHPQVIGVLFPTELASKAGVTITRDFTQNPAAGPADQSDNYQIQFLQHEVYAFALNSTSLPAGVKVTIFDSTGNQVLAAPMASSGGATAFLAPGTYVVRVGDWPTTQANKVTYQLAITLIGAR